MRNYDEDPIRARSAVTWEGYQKMYRNLWRTRGRVLMAMFVLYGLALGMYFFLAIMMKSWPDALVVSAFAGGMAVFFLCFLRLRGTIGAKRIYQKTKRYIGEGYDFTFFSGRWAFSHKSESYEEQVKTGYSQMYRVMEADDAFYVFPSSVVVCIIPKADIENAEPQELGVLLRKGVKPSRYKVLVRPRR